MLRGAVEADGSVEIFIAVVVGELGGRVTRLGHRAGVELADNVGRSDIGADYALQMDLHLALTQPLLQRMSGFDDEPFVKVANAIAVEGGKAKTVGDAVGLRGVGTCEPNHLERGAAAERDDGSR